MEPNRVELEDGRWAEVRRLSIGDIEAAKFAAHDRGFEDSDLDAIVLLRGGDRPSLITACSDGAVSTEFVNSLTEGDFARVWIKAKGMDSPNPSAASSTGTRRSREKVSRPSNG